MKMKSTASLLTSLQHHQQTQPDRTALTFLHEDQTTTELTYRKIWSEVQTYAAALYRTGVQPGDLVILVLPQSLELVHAFLGAVYLGAVPSIFAFLSSRMDAALYHQRVKTLVAQSGAKCVITFPDFQAELETLLSGLDCRVLNIAVVKNRDTIDLETVTLSTRSGEDTAFVQYSSGTTGLQKGVPVSHQAIVEQIKALSRVVNLQVDDVEVSWLPLNHDMGLIAGMLLPLMSGIPLVLMSPFYWVRSPSVLFWAIDRYHATHCYMPNFAYSHCTLNIRERDMEGLDVAHMRMFMSGGEPVHYETLMGFLKRFEPYGVRPEMLSAGYGLAEVTCGLSTTPAAQFPHVDWVDAEQMSREKIAKKVDPNNEQKMSIVSCGKIMPGTLVKIVDEAQNILPDRVVGEVLMSGSFAFQGYFQQPDLSSTVLKDNWVHTGDLGYIAEGELYICGRKKDLMIIGGQNFFPEYLEQAVLEISEIRPGRSVAFGVEDPKLGTEMAVMICELKEPLPEEEQHRVIREVRRRVVQATDIALGDIRLVERGWIYKTSSGKKARNLNREKYLKEFIGRVDPKL